MKKILTLFFLILFSGVTVFCSAPVMAQTENDIESYELTDDPRFDEARESFKKGLHNRDRGDRLSRVNPGKARRKYEHAEEYFLDAAFKYREKGRELGIDTKEEVAICNEEYRKTHVKTNEARSMARNR